MTDHHVSAIEQMRRRVEALAGLQMSPAARLVAWALLLHANPGGHCWPGTATLRRLTGLDGRTIRRIRPTLGPAFDYAPGGSAPGAKRQTSRYRFRLDRGQDAPGAEDRPRASAPPDQGPDAPGTEGAMPPEPGAVCPPKDHQGPTEGSTNGRASKKRPSVARIVREMTEATAPPWPRRVAV